MSVPAFKNSKSKVRRRRSHHGLKPVRVQIDKETGEAHLPHHAVQADEVITPAPKKAVAKAKKEEKPAESTEESK